MDDRDPDSLKTLCDELARKLMRNPSRQLLEMTLRHSGRLRSSSEECSRATYCCNCRLVPGLGSVTWRTW